MSLLLILPRRWSSGEAPPIEPPKSGPLIDLGGGAATAGKRYEVTLKTAEELKTDFKAELLQNWENTAKRSDELIAKFGSPAEWREQSKTLADELAAAKAAGQMLDAIAQAKIQENLQAIAAAVADEDEALLLLIASMN